MMTNLTVIAALLLIATVVITGFSSTRQNKNFQHRQMKQTTPSLVINPSRLQLMKDGLKWLDLRRNGTLLTEAELEAEFLGPILERYQTSSMYRSFVIAFQLGVLPRMTQGQNSYCDPAYPLEFKNPWNSSVTWHRLKKFTFDSYKKRSMPGLLPFCDYRLGLVCHPGYRTCVCPEGSSMYFNAPGSTEMRCALPRGGICNLIDLDHGYDPTHQALRDNLPMMIFNPEKPIGCAHSTTCRFQKPDINTPFCYRTVDDLPFDPPANDTSLSWTLKLGAECALDLIADPGSCEANSEGQYGQQPGLTCYNLGLPFQDRSNQYKVRNETGFCLPEVGPNGLAKFYSLANNQLSFHPMFLAFVHPRNVPMRDDKLLDYIKRLQDDVYTKLLTQNILQFHAGDRCSLSKTEKFKDIWEFYSGLDSTKRPLNQDFTSDAMDEKKMNLFLEAAVNLTADPNLRVCKIYLHYYKDDPELPAKEYPALDCVPTMPPDEFGNDGVCNASVSLNNDTHDFAVNLQNFLDDTSAALEDNQMEEYAFDHGIILANPEVVCNVTTGTAPSGMSDTDALLAGYCLEGYVCFRDLGDYRGIYDEKCVIRVPESNLQHSCKMSSYEVEYGRCEDMHLDRLISVEINITLSVRNLTLGIDQACRLDMETGMRDWLLGGGMTKISKYKLLFELSEDRIGGYAGGGLCDTKRLLECSGSGTCHCAEDTRRRKVTVEGVEYSSDYCYLTKGSCKNEDVTKLVSATPDEKQKLWEHYGNPAGGGDLCKDDGNLCFILDEKNGKCVSGEEVTGGGGETGGGGGDGDAQLATDGAVVDLRGNWRIIGGAILFSVLTLK